MHAGNTLYHRTNGGPACAAARDGGSAPHRLVGAPLPGFTRGRHAGRPSDVAVPACWDGANAARGCPMSLNALQKGSHVTIGPTRFVMLHKVSAHSWQLQNTTTGEWCTWTEDELLEQFSRNALVFDRDT